MTERRVIYSWVERGTPDAELSEHEKLTRDLAAARDEIRELTRQRDDARALVVRSGYFTDCEETGAGQDCIMWHRSGQHIGIAASSDHSVGVDGKACTCDWCSS